MMKPEIARNGAAMRAASPVSLPAEKAASHEDGRNLFSVLNPKPVPASAKRILGKALPGESLIALHQAIETALPDMECRIIQFASCNAKEGTTRIGTQLANFAAATLGQRILLLDITPADSPVGALCKKRAVALLDVAYAHAPLAGAIARGAENSLPFDYAYLTADTAPNAILPHQEKTRQLLAQLRAQYQMVVLHHSGILANPLGITLSRLIDGVILVIEAERTRGPAAKNAVQLMIGKGVKIIGMVFNKHRHYIPNWVYRWL